MIRITKPAAPAVLTSKGAAATRSVKARHRASRPHRAGTTPFKFSSKLYGHHTVRDALKAAQRGKCAFCECRIDATNYGDVEHYRPKAAYRQNRGDPLTRPGYYWLAYEWDNLFLSCQLCNQEFKENLFPLAPNGVRATSHTKSLAAEQPLLLHPEHDDPEQHLTFVNEHIMPRNGSSRGAATIEVLGLDRDAMNEERRRRRRILLQVCEARDLIRARLAKLKRADPSLLAALIPLDQALVDAVADDAPFAAMARVMLA